MTPTWAQKVLKNWYIDLFRNQLPASHFPGHPGGGGSFIKIVLGCACRTSKIWLSLYQFFAKFPTHQYTIFEKKAPNLDQIGCFLQQFAQNTPNLCNLGSFVSDENPPIAIPNFAKKCPKRQAHIYTYTMSMWTYTMSMWEPPGSRVQSLCSRKEGYRLS